MKMLWPYSGVEATRENIKACVGAGWGSIINRLIDDITAMGWDGQVFQVKEKFGGLRFYIGGATDKVHERIHEAEAESYKVCELCGEKGQPNKQGWIVTLCKECRQKKDS